MINLQHILKDKQLLLYNEVDQTMSYMSVLYDLCTQPAAPFFPLTH